MATTRKLAELFRALAAEDVPAASAIAGEICRSEDRHGHPVAARVLRGALHGNGHARGNGHNANPAPPNGHNPVWLSALARVTPRHQYRDVVLAPAARAELDAILTEWRNRKTLQHQGIPLRNKLFFYGPPGCGKSITAQSLALALDLPAFLVRFDVVIGAFLGQTAMHLRQIFSFAETSPCVLIIDELDALGKQRGNPMDIGELDRIAIALMQELEHAKPQGLIVATSNLAKSLDAALWRRFDLKLPFRPPSPSVLSSFAADLAAQLKIALPTSALATIRKADSFASAETIVMAAARRSALAPSLKR